MLKWFKGGRAERKMHRGGVCAPHACIRFLCVHTSSVIEESSTHLSVLSRAEDGWRGPGATEGAEEPGPRLRAQVQPAEAVGALGLAAQPAEACGRPGTPKEGKQCCTQGDASRMMCTYMRSVFNGTLLE